MQVRDREKPAGRGHRRIPRLLGIPVALSIMVTPVSAGIGLATMHPRIESGMLLGSAIVLCLLALWIAVAARNIRLIGPRIALGFLCTLCVFVGVHNVVRYIAP